MSIVLQAKYSPVEQCRSGGNDRVRIAHVLIDVMHYEYELYELGGELAAPIVSVCGHSEHSHSV